ncbi:MAG TPA: prolyl oligopeptidase family serine peptidase [Candidatus Krumholzibacteria bacterium]|nr:prolyl oligopeptidase family serine peptidase [Candidatus Krumholzibacteria bacterium]
MKKARLFFLLGACLVAMALPALAAKPVETRKVDQVDDFFGTSVADPYRWLENVDDPEVQQWGESQNQVTRTYLDGLPAREAMVRRLTELQDYPRYGLPTKEGNWVFASKNDGLQNQSVLYKRKGLDGKLEVLLDPNALSADGTISLGASETSDDGALLAYGLSQSGSDWQVLHVRDVASGKDRADKLERVRFTEIAWAGDKSGFFYCRYPEKEEHFQKVYFHVLGQAQSKDRLVYERPEDGDLGFSPDVSHGGRWLVVQVWKGSAGKDEIFVQDLQAKSSSLAPLFAGFTAEFEFIEASGSKLFFETDLGAPRRRIVVVDMEAPSREPKTVVPEHVSDVISTSRLVQRQLVVSSMHNAYHRLRIYGLDGALQQEVEMPTLGAVTGVSGRPEDPDCFVGFSSFLFPTQNYRLDLATGKLSLYQKAEMRFDPAPFVTRQVFYESKDGTKVPMFLVHKRGLMLDGNNPVWLTGYGGFNISRTPNFSTSRLFWLEQGGVFALPNLRGGGEFGEEWHKAGMLEKKQNVFDDFIAAAEWLVANDYTRTSRLAIEGGSNGGLLTAACALQRPDLYGAVISRVPVTDMLRYQLWTIGSYWVPEYGDPKNAEHFRFLYAYSPVHNVRPGTKFPPMLITTADTDTRVYPAHAKKFAAAVQACNVSDHPILLRVETKAGHGGGKPTAKQIEENADLYGFAMDRLHMTLATPAAAAP